MIIRILLSLVLTFASVNAAGIEPDDILGIWLVEEDGVLIEKVEIVKCDDDEYCGKIIWIQQPDSIGTEALDSKNKKKELRDRTLLGLDVLKGYRFDGKETWRDGEFYAYRKGRTVSPKLTLIDEHHLRLQVKILFVKKSFVWRRADTSRIETE